MAIKTNNQIIFIALIIGLIYIPISDARMGYEVSARVNSTQWSIDRSTQDMDFEIDGSVSGNGSFSKLAHIQNFVGIESHELSSSSNGSLVYEEIMKLKSREGSFIIGATVKSKANESTNESVNVSSDESINIKIDERWPAAFFNHKKISYLGPGIRTRENYRNNGDVVETSINSWKLNKESMYEAQVNRSITSVNITSSGVIERKSGNKTSRYNLYLDTIGSSSELNVLRLDEMGVPKLAIAQDYIGSVRMNLGITMNDMIILPVSNETQDWLECCNASEAEKSLNCSLTPSLESFIFTS